MIGISGATANQAKKQTKNAIHACGRCASVSSQGSTAESEWLVDPRKLRDKRARCCKRYAMPGINGLRAFLAADCAVPVQLHSDGSSNWCAPSLNPSRSSHGARGTRGQDAKSVSRFSSPTPASPLKFSFRLSFARRRLATSSAVKPRGVVRSGTGFDLLPASPWKFLASSGSANSRPLV